MAKTNKKMTLVPLGDRVLVKPGNAEAEKRASGIYIPETASKESPTQGEVIAIGEGGRNTNGQLIPIRVKVGDQVFYAKYSSDKVELEGEEYHIIPESSILAIVK
jgi:chaperonin GroES